MDEDEKLDEIADVKMGCGEVDEWSVPSHHRRHFSELKEGLFGAQCYEDFFLLLLLLGNFKKITTVY